MISTLPREGRRPRARRLIGRLAAALVVGSLGLGIAPKAIADEADAEQPTAAEVELFVAAGNGGRIAANSPLLGTVTIDNATDSDLTAGTVTLEVNSAPLADGAALDAWLDEGTVAGTFRAVASESTPVIADGTEATVSVSADAAALGELAPGVYPLKARLTGASTGDDDASVPWNISASSVLVVAAPEAIRSAVIVPVTATPESDALLSRDELAALTAADGALTALLEAVGGTEAILAVDPAIPAAIRMLGVSAPGSATQWLEQLEALPNDRFALQFADADATVQARAGRAQLLAEPDLTPLLDPANFPPAESEPTESAGPTPTPVAPAEPELPDNSRLTAIRGAQAGILWPRSGVDEKDLAAFGGYLGDGVTTLLPSTAVQGATAAHGAVGARDLLIADAPVSARLSAAVQGERTADRDFAAAAGHLFFSAQRQPLTAIALDRSETRAPDALREALVSFTTPGVSLNTLRDEAPAAVTLRPADDSTRAAALKSMLAGEDRLTAFAGILEEPAVLLAPDRIRILRAIGAGLTDEQFTARTAAHAERLAATLSSVSVQKPKPVQLFTSAAPLPVWVRNDLPWPVSVNLFSTPSDNRLDIQPVTEVEALASSATRIDVPIEARVASGRVDVRFRLESGAGVPIGQPEVADVTLRADWEGIGLGILGTVIGLLFIIGIVRMVRRRRSADTGVAEDTTGEKPTQGEQ